MRKGQAANFSRSQAQGQIGTMASGLGREFLAPVDGPRSVSRVQNGRKGARETYDGGNRPEAFLEPENGPRNVSLTRAGRCRLAVPSGTFRACMGFMLMSVSAL